jgi:2-polyprenyl-6-methoxyphenol hydroxylase-like FAD-dependent oxidoreductase
LEGLREEERLGEKGGEWDEVVKAKYVVGCDGARSWVRK